MEKFCSNCGKEIKEGADICLNCGILLHKNVQKNKVKVPGKGASIAGMVLGIVAVSWAFLALISLEDLQLELINYYKISDYIDYAIGYTLFSFAPSIVGLCLSVSGIKKQKNGKNTSGLVLNTIALVVSIILIITVISYY